MAASEVNYPGGMALHRLHTFVYKAQPELQQLDVINVHIDAQAAMSGVTRFGEVGGKWRCVAVRMPRPGCVDRARGRGKGKGFVVVFFSAMPGNSQLWRACRLVDARSVQVLEG